MKGVKTSSDMSKQRRLHRSHTKKNKLETMVIYDNSLKLKDYLNEKNRSNVTQDRSCYFSPDMKDFGQRTENMENYQHKSEIQEKRVRDLREIENLNTGVKNTWNALTEDSYKSLYFGQNDLETGERIRNVLSLSSSDNEREIKSHVIYEEKVKQSVKEDKCNNLKVSTKDIRISEEPRIKIVAEKFARFRRNNVEVRKLEGRIVCVEYDVYHREATDNSMPVQILRAYFAVTPEYTNSNETSFKSVQNCDTDDNFESIDTGIEIIDAKIPQNNVCLEDLRRFLKRIHNKKIRDHPTALNPLNLYRMAKKAMVSDEISYSGLLSKAELEEIKELILKKTASSFHGISRRKLGPKRDSKYEIEREKHTIIDEILRLM